MLSIYFKLHSTRPNETIEMSQFAKYAEHDVHFEETYELEEPGCNFYTIVMENIDKTDVWIDTDAGFYFTSDVEPVTALYNAAVSKSTFGERCFIADKIAKMFERNMSDFVDDEFDDGTRETLHFLRGILAAVDEEIHKMEAARTVLIGYATVHGRDSPLYLLDDYTVRDIIQFASV